jgi:hypothetical protein
MDIRQRGQIIFEGREATKFWIRALDLEKDIEQVRVTMGERIERKWGSIPIVAEYQVGPNFKWIFIIVANVDILGIKDGTGVLYYASPDCEAEVLKKRDAQADDILSGMEKEGRFDEVIVLPEKKES